MRERPFDFAVATLISFQVNLFCYLAIKYVSATSFKVAGCLKNVLVVWGGVLQGDVVTPQELQASVLVGMGPARLPWTRPGCQRCAARPVMHQHALMPGLDELIPRLVPAPQGYAVSLVGFVLFSASKLRGTVPGAGQTGDSQSPAKKQR